MHLLIVFLTALIIASVGFIMYVYFFSVGYGFSIAGIGIVLLIMLRANITPATLIMCLLFIIYGARLGGYLLYRELKSTAGRVKVQCAGRCKDLYLACLRAALSLRDRARPLQNGGGSRRRRLLHHRNYPDGLRYHHRNACGRAEERSQEKGSAHVRRYRTLQHRALPQLFR